MRRTARKSSRQAIVPGENFVRRTKAESGQNKGNSRNSSRQAHGRVFRPGDVIRESGIYEVIHDQSHRTAHEVVMITKDLFPSCDTCLDRVRFRLVRTAPYIFQDLDFDAPES
jgi:hypothetical protein